MNCADASPWVAALADGEIGGLRAARMRRHLATCPDCAALHRSTRGWSARLRDEAPVHRAPAELVSRLEARFASPDPSARRLARPPDRWRWLAAGAAAGVVATLVAVGGIRAAVEYGSRRDEAAEAVVAHVRATAVHDLVQVASSDHHTVKPWLSARLDYLPPVNDLRDEGFALVGARVDTHAGRPVATLVYRYRDHTVDVFVRPAPSSITDLSSIRTIRGFNVVPVTGRDMRWLVVSDVNVEALGGFAAMLAGR